MKEFLFNLDLKQLGADIWEWIISSTLFIGSESLTLLQSIYQNAADSPVTAAAVLIALLGISLLLLKSKSKRDDRLGKFEEEMKIFEGDTPLIDLKDKFKVSNRQAAIPAEQPENIDSESEKYDFDFEEDGVFPESIDEKDGEMEPSPMIDPFDEDGVFPESIDEKDGEMEPSPMIDPFDEDGVFPESIDEKDGEMEPSLMIDPFDEDGVFPESIDEKDGEMEPSLIIDPFDEDGVFPESIDEKDGEMEPSLMVDPFDAEDQETADAALSTSSTDNLIATGDRNPDFQPDSGMDASNGKSSITTDPKANESIHELTIGADFPPFDEKADAAGGQDTDAPLEMEAPGDYEFLTKNDAHAEFPPVMIEKIAEDPFSPTVSSPETEEILASHDLPMKPVRKSMGMFKGNQKKISRNDYEELLESFIFLKDQKG